MDERYGETSNTQVVKINDDFEVTQSWTIPHEILDRFERMSNSGGSWTPTAAGTSPATTWPRPT